MNTILICLKVFIVRMFDVSLGSARTIFLVKGKNLLASVLAFIEMILWFSVAKEIFSENDENLIIIMCYALGYAVGTYIGGLINKHYLRGTMTAIIVTNNARALQNAIKKAGFGSTKLDIKGSKAVLLIQFNKKDLNRLKNLINEIDNSAFYILNETYQVNNGFFS